MAVRLNTRNEEWEDRTKKMVGRDLERYENCRCVHSYEAGDRVRRRFTTRPPEETENRKRHARIHRVPYTGCAFDVCINRVR